MANAKTMAPAAHLAEIVALQANVCIRVVGYVLSDVHLEPVATLDTGVTQARVCLTFTIPNQPSCGFLVCCSRSDDGCDNAGCCPINWNCCRGVSFPRFLDVVLSLLSGGSCCEPGRVSRSNSITAANSLQLLLCRRWLLCGWGNLFRWWGDNHSR